MTRLCLLAGQLLEALLAAEQPQQWPGVRGRRSSERRGERKRDGDSLHTVSLARGPPLRSRADCETIVSVRWLGLLCAGFLAVAAAGAPAAPSRPLARGAVCAGQSSVDVYFWPRGHPAVPEIGFPAFAPPHLELYRAHDVSNAGFLAYADATRANTSAACAAGGAPPAWGGGPAATTADQQRLSCTLPGAADARRGPWTRVVTKTRFVRVKGKRRKRVTRTTVLLGSTFTLSVDAGALVLARIGFSSSSLRWDTRYCRAVPLSPP